MNGILRKCGVSDYTKIRSYAISQIVKSGSTPMRLASVRDIARQFGVSHPTVVKALKDLIADGFLKAKPGRSGTFTCPEKLNAKSEAKIIGFLCSDGKEVFINRYNNNLTFALTDALQAISDDYLIRRVDLVCDRPQAASEILNMGLNGLVWTAPTADMRPSFEKLKDAGLPLLAAGAAIPGINSLYSDVEVEYRKATGLLLDEGRRRVALLIPCESAYPHAELARRGWRTAFAERAIPCDEALLLTQGKELERRFEETLGEIKPDGFCFCDLQESYYNKLKGKLDLDSQCRVYSVYSSITGNMRGYVGYVGRPQFQKAAKRAAEGLAAQISEGRASTSSFHIKMDIDIAMETQTREEQQ